MLRRLAEYMGHPDAAGAASSLHEFYRDLESAGLNIDPENCLDVKFDGIGGYVIILARDPGLFLVIETRYTGSFSRRELSVKSYGRPCELEVSSEGVGWMLSTKDLDSCPKLADTANELGVIPANSGSAVPIGYEDLQKLLHRLSSL